MTAASASAGVDVAFSVSVGKAGLTLSGCVQPRVVGAQH